MPIVVTHKMTGEAYVLLGAGYGEYKTKLPGVPLGSLTPIEEAGSSPMLAACNANGQIQWLDSKDLYVQLVDGVPPSVALEAQSDSAVDVSPADSTKVDPPSDENIASYLDQE